MHNLNSIVDVFQYPVLLFIVLFLIDGELFQSSVIELKLSFKIYVVLNQNAVYEDLNFLPRILDFDNVIFQSLIFR